jgi:hypothetical protein
LDSFGFKENNIIHENITLMRYDFKPYLDSDLYLFVPVFKTGDIIVMNEQDSSGYLAEMKMISKSEFFDDISQELSRISLGQFEIVISNDSQERIFSCQADVFLTSYKRTALLLFRLQNNQFDPSFVLDNCSSSSFLIKVFESFLSIDAFSAKYGFSVNGRTRTFSCFQSKPSKRYLSYLLAGEQYQYGVVKNTSIKSTFLDSKMNTNLSNYDFSEIYCSEFNVVYVMKEQLSSLEDRKPFEELLIFILEILTLQINLISENNSMISKEISSSHFSLSTHDEISRNYSETINIWSLDEFKYLLARELAYQISNEFKIPEMKQDYAIHLKQYEELSSYASSKETSRVTKVSQRYFSIFTMLSGISTVSTIVALVFATLVPETKTKSIVSLVLGGCVLISFLLLLLYNGIIHKQNKTNQK